MSQETLTTPDNPTADAPPRVGDARDLNTPTHDLRAQTFQERTQTAAATKRVQSSANVASTSYARSIAVGVANAAAPSVVTSNNLILSALPASEFDVLATHLIRVNLAQGETLYEVGEEIVNAYFPLDAVVSSLSMMKDGDSLEVGVIGNEGVVGLSIIFGAERAPLRTIVQVAGRALRLDARMLRAAFMRGGAMQKLLLRYTNANIMQISQAVACNRLHHIEQRLACWLLALHDRAQRDDLNVTHEFIARMLGVRRAGITDALGLLNDAGMISLARGRIAVTDRLALETAACECYRAVKEEFENLYR